MLWKKSDETRTFAPMLRKEHCTSASLRLGRFLPPEKAKTIATTSSALLLFSALPAMPLIADDKQRWQVLQSYLQESVGLPAEAMPLRQAGFVHLFLCNEIEACRAPNAESWHAVHLGISFLDGKTPKSTVLKLLGLEIAAAKSRAFDVYPLTSGGTRYNPCLDAGEFRTAHDDWSRLFVYDHSSNLFRCLETLYPRSLRKAIREGVQEEVAHWVECMFSYAREHVSPVAGDLDLGAIGICSASSAAQLQPYRTRLEKTQVEYHAPQTSHALQGLAPESSIQAVQAQASQQQQQQQQMAAAAAAVDFRIPPPPWSVNFGADVAVSVQQYEDLPRVPNLHVWHAVLARAKQARFELYGAFDLEAVRKVSPAQGKAWDNTNRKRAADALAQHLYSKGILEPARDHIDWVELHHDRKSFVVQLAVSTCNLDDAQRIYAVGSQVHGRASPYSWHWFASAHQRSSGQPLSRVEAVGEHKQGAAAAIPAPIVAPQAEEEKKAVEEQPVLSLPSHYMSVSVRGGKTTDVNLTRTSGAQVNTAQTAPYRILVYGIDSYKAAGDTSVGLTENVAERQADAAFILERVRALVPPQHLGSLLFLLRHIDMRVELGFARTCAAAAVKASAPLALVPCTRFFAQ
jgi:hypothetical protein